MGLLSRKELKIYLAVTGIIAVAAVLITLLTALPGSLRSRSRSIDNSRETAVSRRRSEFGFFLSELIIPDTHKKAPYSVGPLFFRGQRDAWSDEEIRRYWIDPQKVFQEHLESENEKLVEEFLGKIP